MSNDLTPRGGSRLSRKQREDRGFQLVVAGGIAATITVVGLILAVVGVIGWGLPLLGIFVTAGTAWRFRKLAASR